MSGSGDYISREAAIAAVDNYSHVYFPRNKRKLEELPAADVRPCWIPVTDRLPEDLTRVIVFCDDGVSFGLCEHLVADDEEVVEWHDFLHYPITPTHWMPLPEPPKEET